MFETRFVFASPGINFVSSVLFSLSIPLSLPLSFWQCGHFLRLDAFHMVRNETDGEKRLGNNKSTPRNDFAAPPIQSRHFRENESMRRVFSLGAAVFF